MKYLKIILLIFTILICIIFPVFNIYFIKFFSVFILSLAILLLFFNKKKIILVILITMNLTYILDNGFFYNINTKYIYSDKNIIVVKKNKFWEFLSCGATFWVYKKNMFTLNGKEIISSNLCQKENPKIIFNEEGHYYNFYVNNLYQTKVKRYYLIK